MSKMRPTVVVEQDYDGYFESLVNRWLDKAEKEEHDFKFSKIVVSAGPWRPIAVAVDKVDEETVQVDFYAALRVGFGSLSDKDVADIIEML